MPSERSWVLVTGAASGIGRATAVAFAAAGANLVLADLDASELEGTCESVWAHGRDGLARAVDVSDAEEMSAFAEWVHGEMLIPALDVLVNNAGVGIFGAFLDTPPETWQRVVQVNLLGVVNGCRTFLPTMLSAGGRRRVVNVASVAGLAPACNMSAHATAHHAVVGFSESLALELRLAGAQVGVSTVCLGIVGNGVHSVGQSPRPSIAAHCAACRASPEVIAAAIVGAVRRPREVVLVGAAAQPLYGLLRVSRHLAQRLVLCGARCASRR